MWLDLYIFDIGCVMDVVKEYIGFIGSVIGKLLCLGVGVLMWMINLVLILVVVFYLLCDWDCLVVWIDVMLLCFIELIVVYLVCELDKVFGVFVCG